MSIKSFIEQNQIVAVAAAVVALLLGGFLIVRGMQGETSAVLVPKWAYDLNTGTIMVAAPAQLAPFDTDSGTFSYPGMATRGAGVDAHIYTCGDPSQVKEGMTAEDLQGVDARLVFVTRYTDAAVDALLVPPDAAGNENVDVEARLMSSLAGDKWVPSMSPPAFGLREKAIAKCDSGDYPMVVEP
ncbi:MAG: hypothetical protein AAGA25_03955 [Planctomycetota bacterium]